MKYSVIVVDDERLIAKNIASKIEAANPLFQVKNILSCGTDAVDYIRTYLPNVVFTDIRMPEMDGLELAKIIATEFPFITCVIVSGYNDFTYAKQAMEFQVNHYLLKPINVNELTNCLQKIEIDLSTQHPNLEKLIDEHKKSWSSEEIVELIKEYICKNYQSQIDLTTIANNLGFSSAYLSKVFSKHMGTSPSKYLKEYRIMIAKQLLSKKDLPIYVISLQTGFLDQFHFSKTFRSSTGYSPSEYRQLMFSNNPLEIDETTE